MPVSHLHTVTSPDAELTARELVSLAGQEGPWLLPDDCILDSCAVAVAVDGARRVRLTRAERVIAAYRILTDGGSVRSVCLRLGLPEDTERVWLGLQNYVSSAINSVIITTGVNNEQAPTTVQT